jgi:hypothetical protein
LIFITQALKDGVERQSTTRPKNLTGKKEMEKTDLARKVIEKIPFFLLVLVSLWFCVFVYFIGRWSGAY